MLVLSRGDINKKTAQLGPLLPEPMEMALEKAHSAMLPLASTRAPYFLTCMTSVNGTNGV